MLLLSIRVAVEAAFHLETHSSSKQILCLNLLGLCLQDLSVYILNNADPSHNWRKIWLWTIAVGHRHMFQCKQHKLSSYQNGDYSFMLLLNQVTDDLVVKIWNWFPLAKEQRKNKFRGRTLLCNCSSSLEPGSSPTKEKFNYTAKGLQSETHCIINTVFPTWAMQLKGGGCLLHWWWRHSM